MQIWVWTKPCSTSDGTDQRLHVLAGQQLGVLGVCERGDRALDNNLERVPPTPGPYPGRLGLERVADFKHLHACREPPLLP